MSLTSALCAHLKSPSKWSSEDINEILKEGDIHHAKVLQYLNQNQICSNGYSSVDDVIEISPLEFQNQMFNIENKNAEFMTTIIEEKTEIDMLN